MSQTRCEICGYIIDAPAEKVCPLCGDEVEEAEREKGESMDKYQQWISEYKGIIYRKCVEVTNEMMLVFPELRIAKGMVTILEDGKDYPHQWLVDPSGNIIDPTAKQWIGILEYREIKEEDQKPIGKCYNCGNWVFGKYINGMFCPRCAEMGVLIYVNPSR